uniref:RING-type E3 ubiquitin transferase n=1 Tax=Rhizophora mucronata TaxID=61149 RepID=A0A2P2JW22_RHIMU
MGLTVDPKYELVSRLFDSVKVISGLPECRTVCKKMHGNLVRRIKLLSPLLEELKDSDEDLSQEEVKGLELLQIALDSAMELLKSIYEESKLYQALVQEKMANKFHQTMENIEAALNEIPYEKLDVSEEVREQVELVHAQFRRAKERPDSPDAQLDLDLAIAEREKDPDPAILRRLSEKLHLKTIDDLKKESLAFHELVISSDGDPGEWFEKMSNILRKLKDYIQVEIPEGDTSDAEKSLMKHRFPVIPDDFRCPISLELMKDPVIVSTGQVI